MQTPKVGGRYKRHADGTVVPADYATATPAPRQPEPPTTVPDVAPATHTADSSNPEEGE